LCDVIASLLCQNRDAVSLLAKATGRLFIG
jgi:hypothetical protein